MIEYSDVADVVEAIGALHANLTASVHADDDDAADAGALAAVMRRKAGRVIYNGWPTGVAVCWAMHHGGPWPASTAAAHTSVGATAIDRWLIPVAYQDWPDALLPAALQAANPLGIRRRVDAVLE